MKSSIWRAWLGAAAIGLAAVMPAQAVVVTFDDVGPGFAAGGSSLNSGGFTFTDDNFGGYILLDGAGSPPVPPANASGQFLSMYNNAGVTMTSSDGSAFFLNSFDAAFLGYVPFGAGFLGGELTAWLFPTVGAMITEIFVLPAGELGGDYPFSTFFLGSRGTALNEAYFFACAYQNNSCPTDGSGAIAAQFALDNLAVPEPGSAFLALTALGVLFIRRRKATAV